MAEQQQLTEEQRRRNVRRVETVEGRLGHVEQRAVSAATELASIVREVHALRGELRRALNQDPLPPLAPVFTQASDEDGGDDDG